MLFDLIGLVWVLLIVVWFEWLRLGAGCGLALVSVVGLMFG